MGTNNWWTAARCQELSKHWTNGMKALDIGVLMGKTKNSIIGKANRMRLPPRQEARHIKRMHGKWS